MLTLAGGPVDSVLEAHEIASILARGLLDEGHQIDALPYLESALLDIRASAWHEAGITVHMGVGQALCGARGRVVTSDREEDVSCRRCLVKHARDGVDIPPRPGHHVTWRDLI